MGTRAEIKEKLVSKLKSRTWRLDNLYHIVDKYGIRVKFKANWAQREVLNNLHNLNVILKARQLGISTFICILFLDACLFNKNVAAGIIAHTREDAQKIFEKVKFAFDNLPIELQEHFQPDTSTVRELKFPNGSSIRVGTSMRGTSLQYLHISEFGKICAKYPQKAKEIITGSLNTVAKGQFVFIESTAEGRSGYFYDMCTKAQKLSDRNVALSEMDYRFFFFPWWKHSEYHAEDVSYIIPEPDLVYFQELRKKGIDLTHDQQVWYSRKKGEQGDDMMREFPSTPEESFMMNTDGLYYGKQMREAYVEKRIGRIPWDRNLPVHTAWDLGYRDSTSIWFFQVNNGVISLIDYYEWSRESLEHYVKVIKEKPYCYGSHFVPHDARVTEFGTGLTRIEIAQNFGLTLTVAPNISLIEGINTVRSMFHRCYFDEGKCAVGIKALENYSKEWNEAHATFKEKPLHNEFSHGADAFRILALCWQNAESGGMTEDEAMAMERMYS